MRYWINELAVVNIKDVQTLKELRSFVRFPNGTWAGKREAGVFDDRVMSLVWSLIVLEKEVTEKHYDIIDLDDNGKPQKIKNFDYGERIFSNPLSLYNNEKVTGDGYVPPIAFGMGESHQEQDMQELMDMGWQIPGSPADDANHQNQEWRIV